jgi:amino acid adenylation domain-containing protein
MNMRVTTPAARLRSLPATAAQRRLALAANLRPQDPATNFAVFCRLPAGIDPHRMARAVRAVLDGDDSYNEVFGMDADGGFVATLMRGRTECPVTAYASFAELSAAVQRLADTPIDIEKWPLYHVEIASVGADLYFVFTGSHLILDAFGFFQFIEDIDANYRDPVHRAGYTKSPSEACYQECAVGPSKAYFAGLFAGVDSLAIDGWGRRDEQGRLPGTITRYASPPDGYEIAGALAKRLGVRRYSVLLTVYGLAVGALARRRTVAISNPMSNRRRSGEGAKTRGLMTNALPVVVDMTSFTSFSALCADVDRQVGILIGHEGCSFADIARELLRDADIDATVPSASFTLYPRPIAPVVDGEPGVPVPVDRRFLQYPLSLNIEVSDGPATLIVERADDVPDVDVPALFWGIVRQAAGYPGVRLTDMAWADAPDRSSRRPLVQMFEPARTIIDEFAAAVRRRGGATAIECGGESISYQRLDAESDVIAAQIDSAFAGDDQRYVGVSMEPSHKLVAVLLGIMKSGRAYVPLQPGLPRARVQSMVQVCGGLTVLGTVDDDWADIAGLRHHTLRSGSPIAPPVAGPRPDDTAYVIFTSGTTGEPKGVPITHKSVTSMFSSVAAAMPIREMRWSLYHSFAFDASVWEIFGSLLFDGVLCIPTADERADPGKMAHFLRHSRVGMLSQTPSAFEALGPRIMSSEYSPETIVFFGERLDFSALKEFATRHPRTRLVNMYGITETTVHAAFYQLPRQIDRWPARSVIGAPLCDMSIMVVDPDRRVLPRGCPGELAVGGAGVMAGYLNRDDLTRDRITVIDGQRVYLTGDLGVMTQSGELEYIDRIDSQVQIRGHRIELAEVERALLNCPHADRACVVPVGEGLERHLAAFVVVRTDVPTAEILRFACSHLPCYMVPARVIPVSDLPITVNGKTDRAALIRAAFNRQNGPGRADLDDLAELEVRISQVWADVLGHRHFDRDTRFFDAGGSSALLLGVSHEVQTRLRVDDLNVIDLFEHCTPAALATFLYQPDPQRQKVIR